MKNFLTILTLIYSVSTLASPDKGVKEATLRINEAFDLAKLVQIGSTVKNLKNDDILRHHCVKKEKTGECAEIIHILSTENKNLVLIDREGKKIIQNVPFIKERLDYKLRDSLLNFTDFDPVYRRNAGDFTGYLGMSCIYEPKTCGMLVLLPVAIAADIVMMPLDITMNESQRYLTRKRAKFFIENLESDEQVIELENREFNSLMKGLSQF
jgi:hypothetical protein